MNAILPAMIGPITVEIDNVELIQMDILEVSLLEEQFDIILCSGVLHHMDDPSKGLKTLLGVLKKQWM